MGYLLLVLGSMRHFHRSSGWVKLSFIRKNHYIKLQIIVSKMHQSHLHTSVFSKIILEARGEEGTVVEGREQGWEEAIEGTQGDGISLPLQVLVSLLPADVVQF
jgi:hypothetical protein